MNATKIAPLMMMASLPVMAETINFDADPVGTAPSGWTAGVTGRGAQRWTVEADASAPSRPNVLKQSGRGDFPWCVKNDPQFADGYVEVKFKPVSGKEDQAGGVVWRWKDGDNYYVARANALGRQRLALLHAEWAPDHAQVRGRAGSEGSVAHAARGVRRQAHSCRA